MKFGFKQIIMTSALAAILTPAALAQSADNPFQRGRYTAVTERSQRDFDPEPMRAGAFYIRSNLGLSAEYNDNIFATDTLQDDDTVVRVRPEAEVRSNWTVHELDAGLMVDSKQYLSNSSESVTDYNGFLAGRLDVQRSFQLTGRLVAAHITEPRYAPASSGAPDPAQYNRAGYTAGAIFRTDRIRLEASAGVTDDDFDIATVNRDVSDSFVYGRASYAWSPDVSFFVQGRKSEQDYDDAGSLLNPDRDGERSSFEIGTSFELQAPFRGEIAIGSVKEDKVDPTRPDLDGLSANAQVQWFPSQLTTVTFRANSSVFDPGLAASASALDTRYGARIDHELFRNILLYGDLGFGTFDFEGAVGGLPFDREDKFTDFATGLAWKLNKHARLEADYRVHTQESTGANRGQDLDQNIFSVGVRFYP